MFHCSRVFVHTLLRAILSSLFLSYYCMCMARAALDERGPRVGAGEAGGSTLSNQPNKHKQQSLFQIVCTDAKQMK